MITHKQLKVYLVLCLICSVAYASQVSIVFKKVDYTGTWGNSIFHLQDNATGTWIDYFNQTWFVNGETAPATCTTDYSYKIIVTKPGNQIDKGIIKFYQNGTQPISLTAPIITYGVSPIENLTINIYQNRSENKIYCFYNASNLGYNSSTFNVYNATTWPIELISTSSDTENPIGLYQYVVTNVNYTYVGECIVTIDDIPYSNRKSFQFGNFTTKFMGDNAPSNFLGYTTTDVFRGLSLFLIIFVLGFASPINSSILTLGGVGMLWISYFWGWITFTGDETQDLLILGFILTLAVVYRLKQAKEEKG